MKVCFLLEQGNPPRRNPVIAEAGRLLEGQGVEVAVRYPDEELVRLDRLRVEADLYLLKSNTELALSLATALEALGARVLNRADVTGVAKNKALAAAVLLQAGIPTPRSLAAGRPAQLAPALVDGPLIVKPHRGHYGHGIVVVDEPAALPAAAAYPDLVFAQRYLAAARTDLKVFAIGDEVFGVRKPFRPGSFLDAGEPSPLSPEIEAIARRCGPAFGLELYGVDIAEAEEGPCVLEVNAFPGYRGVPDAARRLTAHVLGAIKAA